MNQLSRRKVTQGAMLSSGYHTKISNRRFSIIETRRVWQFRPNTLRTCKSRVLPLSRAAGDEDENKNGKKDDVQEEDDWGVSWSVSNQDGGMFKRDGPFAIFLIIVSTVLSTILFQMGFRRIKNVSRITKSSRALNRSSVYAPVVPKEQTAKRYQTGWPDDTPDHWSSTVEDDNKLPLRTPDGENDLDMAIASQRQQYERLKEQVDGNHASSHGKDNGREGQDFNDWDTIFSDDEAPYTGMSLSEMKDRAKKASKSATRAAGYAHQASIAASIATKASHDAQSAAHRAIEAAMKSERALERKSGQAIVEAYTAARKAEDEAEKNTRVAAEMAAKSLMDEKSGMKASREAIACEDLTKPHGVVNKLQAMWYDVSSIASQTASSIAQAGSYTLSACHNVSLKLTAQAKNFMGLIKEQLPKNKISS